jgi:hypothetical protein
LMRALGSKVRERSDVTYKSLLISWGEIPHTPCDATYGDKQTGEVNRALPGIHKLAEPIKVGRTGTSDLVDGLASKLAMARETEPMADAPVDAITHQLGSEWVGWWRAPPAGGVLVRTALIRTGAAQHIARQPRYGIAWYRGRIPHGVESAPKAGERSATEPKNLVIASDAFGRRTADAASDHGGEGRSLRSSPRTGKPFTWRREAVDTDCRQEVDACPAR